MQVVEASDCSATFQQWANAAHEHQQPPRSGSRGRHVSFAEDTHCSQPSSSEHSEPTCFLSSSGIAASRAMQQVANPRLQAQSADDCAPMAWPAANPAHMQHKAVARQSDAQHMPPAHVHAPCSSGNSRSNHSPSVHEEAAQLRMEREHIAAVRANMEQSVRALEQERQAFEVERVCTTKTKKCTCVHSTE